MRNFFALILGWILWMFAVTGQQHILKADTIPLPVSFSYTGESIKTETIDVLHKKPSSSEDGYHKNRNIIVGVIIGVVLILVLIK